MTAPSISIALCTYNGERYLAEQLESIERQTLSAAELIVCDDGSSDSTVKILDQFRAWARFPVHIVCNQPRLGVPQNFARAISLCSKDIIVLCDQDDVWFPGKLQAFTDAFSANKKAVVAFSDAEFMNQEGTLQNERLWDAVQLRNYVQEGTRLFRRLLRFNLIPGSSMAFRRSLCPHILPIAKDWMHDHWIILIGLLQAEAVALPECLFKYRRHPAQVCGWRKANFWELVRNSLQTNQQDWQLKVEMWEELKERIESTHLVSKSTNVRLGLLELKQRHLNARRSIRSLSGPSSSAHFMCELLSGRYVQYSDSWHSVIRDLASIFGLSDLKG